MSILPNKALQPTAPPLRGFASAELLRSPTRAVQLMRHPNQFTVNDAWIGFRINDAALVTERDGDFDCLALMDAASCYIVGMETYSARATGPSKPESRRLLQSGHSRAGTLPSKLFVTEGQVPDELCQEAARLNIEVVTVPEDELLVFIGEARHGFKERFGSTQ
ncbi:MAG: hypothetical protein OJF47_000057 [Nitrospira sp.]|jgi:hypothetical protein|nr:MAG: hypothetical protein OJF47_000057 [Nitrospira sp.]